ncbi:MAG: Hsp20/alpha crystallin family protein [Acidobacteria bacterium]|nr:MAG: Hsp20/alpha crystallin family protein [Acidobacteriota bacterium]REK02076.1 MAG: Hsp20/alpha crystallin family protein [Acidobacteriota bacterium]REK15034.1 MAG: Hsp20/alpha crystallin family protein [Acidobacteriota bacterium]REK45748.1 MAG: Hsp20/alpha crystallin family protein [Acidobacteriota bacterium]
MMKSVRQKMVGTIADIEKMELERLRSRVERLVAAIDEAMETETSDAYDTFAPPVDICENKNTVSVWFELPGVRRESIELTVSAKEIVLEGDKAHSPVTERATSHFCCERRYGRFHRRIILRWAVNINEVSAELRDGVLHLRLPKLIDRRGKSVKVDVIADEGGQSE